MTDPPAVSRRRALSALTAAVSAAISAGCSSPASPSAAASTGGSDSTSPSSSSCVVAPTETVGPYPDRTGMLSNQAFYRRDVTEGRPGASLALAITVQNTNAACAPLANANVEIWQCDAGGHYSEYAQAGYDGTGQTFLRGLQVTDATGRVTFNTIYPGWYQGRATHVHVTVYAGGRTLKVTQIAFPETVTAEVYGTGVYAGRGNNPTRNANDNVFSDGVEHELATVTGTAAAGYAATITFGVPA